MKHDAHRGSTRPEIKKAHKPLDTRATMKVRGSVNVLFDVSSDVREAPATTIDFGVSLRFAHAAAHRGETR